MLKKQRSYLRIFVGVVIVFFFVFVAVSTNTSYNPSDRDPGLLTMLINYWIVGGIAIFGLYYLLYILIKKKKGSVKPLSIVGSMPLMIGCINILLVMLNIEDSNIYTIYVLYLFIPIAIGTIAASLLISLEMFLLLILLLSATNQQFIIKFCIVGITVVFGLYYLLYIFTMKKSGSVKASSLIVRMPLFIGYINILIAASFPFIMKDAFASISNSMYYEDSYSFTSFFLLLFMSIVCSIAIGTIAFSISVYKKQLISLKRFILIFLLNAISIIIFWWSWWSIIPQF